MSRLLPLLAVAALATAACTSNPQTNKELNCAAGVVGASVAGGVLGNQIGAGTGQTIATAVGAGAGATAATQRQACQ